MNRLLFHFRLWSHVWVLSGFLALVWTDHFGPGLIALAAVGLCLSPLAEKISGRFPGYTRLWTAASLVYLMILPFDLVISDLVLGVTHLLIFIQVVKLLNKKNNRDYIHMYLMSFFQLLAASVLTTDYIFLVALVLFLVSAVWTLALFHLKTEFEQAARVARVETEPVTRPRLARRRRPSSDRVGIVDANLVITNTALALATALLTAGLFYTVPRLEAGFLSRRQQSSEVGFTEEVELATFGQVFSNPTVVMQVELPQFPEGFPGELYWRAMALDRYDGQRWVKLRPPRNAAFTRTFEMSRDEQGVFEPRAVPGNMFLVEQVIYVDSLDTSYLFGLPEMKRVTGDFDVVLWDRYDESWSIRNVQQEDLSYTVYSRLPQLDPQGLRDAGTDYPDAYRTFYVEQLPPALDPRVRSLAAQITEEAANPYDKAAAVESYLRSNYVYRLTGSSGMIEAPLEHFLFDSGVGHCEFFATAMATLLRCVGVPARIASGFRGGEWNEFGAFYAIRQDFAHVWVEVFFPDFGWVPFDPSPAASEIELRQSWWATVRSFVSRYTLALQMKWYKHVIGYNQNRQLSLVTSTAERIRTFLVQSKENLASIGRSSRLIPAGVWRPVVLAVYLGVLSYLVLLLRHLLVVRRRRILAGLSRSLPGQKMSAAALYADMLFAYARRGIVKRPDQAPLEFLSTLAYRPAAEQELAANLIQAYCRTRFGDYPFARTDEKRFREMLKELGRMLKRKVERNPTGQV